MIFNHMPNKRLLLKIFFVILFFSLVVKIQTLSFSDTIAYGTLAFATVVIIAILQKWYFEYKDRKIKKTIPDISTEKTVKREGVPNTVSIIEMKFLIFINIIFIIFSFINSWVIICLASLIGSARAQGELVYFIVFPIFVILAIITTVISYRYLHKQYILRGWIAAILLPASALAMEELAIFLLDLEFGYLSTFIFVAIITTFIFFSPSFRQLLQDLRIFWRKS